MSCGVARRSHQKEGGPSRISNLSYGFEVLEEYDPGKLKVTKIPKPSKTELTVASMLKTYCVGRLLRYVLHLFKV